MVSPCMPDASSASQQKIDLGSATEGDVQRFVEHAFSSDFVFRSPYHVKGGKQKETTDVLVVFGDVAMPIQVKAQAYNADGSPRLADPNWTKKNLEKAVAQVRGAARILRSDTAVRLKNVRRGELEFSRDKSPYLYGLVVLNHVSEPFAAVDVVPELQTIEFPVHVLALVDFYNINRILDTPGDLIAYLEMRADVLIPTLKPHVHDEMPVFKYYLEHLEDLTEFRAKTRGEDMSAADAHPYADALRKIYRRELSDLKASYFIDKIIDRAHEVDYQLAPPFDDVERSDRSEYAVVAEELSEIVRFRRAYLGRQFLDAIKRADKQNDIAFAHASSKRRNQCLLFMASPRPREERRDRNQDLHEFLLLLKATRQVKRAIGIATEAGFGKGRSYDFIVVDHDPSEVMASPDYAEIRRVGEQVFGTATPL